jgi:uncharacterized protein involved in type VI secretion and phage assembly
VANEAVQFGAMQSFETKSKENKIYGVSLGIVLNNIDCTGEARVQLRLPWMPGYTPWARLSAQMAGMGAGSFFVPQVGDEVMVAFHHGDVREPYVLGMCWNTMDKPPSLSPTDAVTKRKIRTPLGHELTFDEAEQSVTLTSNSMSTITLDPMKAEISTPAGKVTIGKTGDITITATKKLTLEAPVVEIKAHSVLKAESSGAATFGASGDCSIKGSVVRIN